MKRMQVVTRKKQKRRRRMQKRRLWKRTNLQMLKKNSLKKRMTCPNLLNQNHQKTQIKQKILKVKFS